MWITVSPMRRTWIGDARRRGNLTQAQLAAAIGKPQNFISRLEHGSDPSWSEAVAIAAALGIDVRTLRFGVKRRQPREAA
jgi:transcriptional regulator with XRE-family HTH domain